MARMAAPEHSATSRRLRAAAQAERLRLRRELDREQTRITRLHKELADREQIAGEIRERLETLAPFADEDSDDSLKGAEPQIEASGQVIPIRGYLKGAEIRIAAVRILAASRAPAQPIHYTEWFRMYTEYGNGIAGHDPQASFLTQIGRSPVTRRATERGLYMLDLEAPRRLRQRLHLLHQELARLHEGQQTIEEIATVATRRTELTREVLETERDLQETLTSLGALENELVDS
jgi:hypothetical protein